MGVYLGRNKVDMLGGTPIALNGTNTSDATVTENDLAKDVIAYGANGRIVGKTPTIKNGVFSKASNCSVHSNAKEYVSVDLMCDSDTLLRSGSGLFYNIDSSRFGNAKKEDVLSGVTFTSSSGLLEEGTLVVKEEEIGNYEYTSNGSKTITPSDGKVFSKVNVNINVPSSGIDTSDATATSEDMANGVTAYVNGEKITGNVRTIASGTTASATASTVSAENNNLAMSYTYANPSLYRKNAKFKVQAPLSGFGTAIASDVAQGVTFTSESGLKVEGELEVFDDEGMVALSSNYDKYNTGTSLAVDIFSESDILIRSGSGLGTSIPFSEFGTATEDKVLEGVTYTGADGFKKTGTYEPLDTSDATVTPETLADGIIAYGSNGRIVGTATLKTFTWKKYNAISSTVTDKFSQQEIEDKYGTKLSHNQITLYSTMSFNASTGVFTLSNGTTNLWSTVYNDAINKTYPYYYINDAHTKVAKIISMTPPQTGSIVNNYGVTYTEYYSLENEPYTKGDYIEDIASTSSYDYPANGYQDGYWYVINNDTNSDDTMQQSLVMKTGTTTSSPIDTGLTSVKQFVIYKDAVAETGLIQGTYNEILGVSYTYCSAYSSSTWGSKTYAIGSTAPTISGGSVTWNGTGTQGLSSGKTYNWVAIGEE